MLKSLSIFLIVFAFLQNAYASHLAAADFKFTQISTNSYQVELNLYRDCSGIGAPNSASIQINSISCSNSFNQTLSLVSSTFVNAIPVSYTTCSFGTINGYEHLIYSGTITLPASCTDWHFSYSSCCRNPYITNLVNPSTESLYVESTIDNTLSNNSPTYFVEPLYYGSIGNSFTVALGGTDPDGDSLSFSLASPLSSLGVTIPFVTDYLSITLLCCRRCNTKFFNTTGLFSCQLGQVVSNCFFGRFIDEYKWYY